MRKITLTGLVTLAALSAQSQNYLDNENLQNRPPEKKVTFWDMQQAFYAHWDSLNPSFAEGDNAEEGGYQQFKRWEWFVKQRTYPSGEFPKSDVLFTEYQKYKLSSAANKNFNTQAANWTFFGPGIIPGNGGGSGRINCIVFDPANSNTIWVGAACGGLWKSVDGGTTWATWNTDLLPSLSVSDLVIDPTNTQVIYVATGDKFGIYTQYETWGHYSAGILKSTDGGLTWNTTGFTNTLANNVIIQRLIMDPTNTNVLYAATFSGIYKTTNGGNTWTNIRPGYFYDIEFNPTNSATIYAGDNAGFQISTNSGTTWNYVSGVTSTGRTSICVTPANAAVVYVWTEGGGFYYSGNSGTSFTPRANPSGQCTPYGYYDMVIEVSPINASVLFAGGMEIARTTNGGTSWTNVSDWSSWPATNYVHADQKNMAFLPGSSTTIFAVNDGGIFRSTNQGTAWTDLSTGIHIKQYYRISSSFQNNSLIYAGAQDNGTDRVNGFSTATQVMGADGEDCLVDFVNDQVVFVSTQGGNFSRSTNGGNTFTGSVNGCDWTSPIVQDPNNNQKIYVGAANVQRSLNNGVSFASISPSLDGTCIYSLEVANSNGNYIYAATFGNLFRTTTGNAPWANITGSLPVGSAAITGVTISGSDPNAIWVCFSGFSAGNKVFYSSNGGASWTNVSGTLPNIPVNCIEYQNGSNDLVYIGTDLGVFYMDATMNDWSAYNTGLPNVIIDDLEVYYPTSKLRAGTYGRGIWQSDLQTSTLQNLDASAFSVNYPPSQTCDTTIAPIVVIRNAGINTITSVDLFYSIDGQPFLVYNWTGSLSSFATANVTLPAYTLGSGSHTLVAYTTNPNLAPDQNNNNDTTSYTFNILANPVGSTPPLQEGFVSSTFPPSGWQLENSNGLWSRSATVGGYSLSTNSARADCYNIASAEDAVISPYIDFNNVITPIRLYFDIAHAPYSVTYKDSLFVEVYTDCDPTGSRIYSKGYTSLATAPNQTGVFVPTSTQWRTDTINLDTLAGDPSMRFRWIVKSGYGNMIYLDNINLTGGLTGTNMLETDLNVNMYPNPTNGNVNVEVSTFEKGDIIVTVYDVTGKTVKETTVNASMRTLISMDVSSLGAGIYVLKIEQNGKVKTERLAILR